MNSIKRLASTVVEQIAAGEVITDPAAVVKELVENSIDAGAEHISIEIHGGGLERISVVDDGHGIAPKQLELALEPHATSKLSAIDDLESLYSFGFRGEALGSIRTVAEVTLRSRRADTQLGHEVVATQHNCTAPKSVGMPVGTQLHVSNLFSTMPGRRKHLSSKRILHRDISKLVQEVALAHPQIAFHLSFDGKQKYSFPAVTSKIERARDVLPDTVSDHLQELSHEQEFLELEAVFTDPHGHQRSRHHQYWYINDRPIESDALASVLDRAYRTRIPKGSFPAGAFFLRLPATLLDVNIHPQKRAVRYMDQATVHQFILDALNQQLETFSVTYQSLPNDENTYLELNDSASLGGTAAKQYEAFHELKASLPLHELFHPSREQGPPHVLQIADTYLAIATPQGLLLFDQHAVHERILFEELKATYDTQKQASRSLTPPLEISLTARQKEVVAEHLDTFEALSFELQLEQEQDTATLLVTSMPEHLDPTHASQFIREVVSDLERDLPVRETDSITERILAYIACRSAVKAGDPLPQEQRQRLVQRLTQLPNHGTCPHGRPTVISVDSDELSKRFRR